jgi:predicted ATP-grasp superfamily ATP-dependent carboligase
MENGPSSVIEHSQHKSMLSTARSIFEAGELSGFCGIDFVIDENDRAWLLELNPRMTPASHLGKFFGEDVIKDFIAALNGVKTLSVNKQRLNRVALFPAEISRNLNSPYFYNTFHDVPWGDPKVLKHIISNLTVLR